MIGRKREGWDKNKRGGETHETPESDLSSNVSNLKYALFSILNENSKLETESPTEKLD